ncbi:hypothetical protein GF362_07145 [Candidatus Dojkabacteria bacterium]|nr:hypothetical protein [Candidatus Dojkabacteria bacterium]
MLINIKSVGNILYILFPFLISLFATLVFLTISQKKKVKSLVQKFRKLFEKDRTLVLSTFDIAYILVSILTIILVIFLGISILKNSNNVIELFEYFILDINRIFATNKNALYWLFGLSFIEIPQTLFTLIFANYGIIGLWSFILLNTYVISKSITLLKNIKVNSVKYFSLILTLISFSTLIIYGILVKWNSTLFLSWWLIIALLALFIIKQRNSSLSKNNEEKIFKLERFGEVIYYISEVLRFSIIVYLVYLLINIISKII